MERAGSGRPVFTVIGGPNGAGKSTYKEGLAARNYPLGEVVNPDVIAADLPGPDAMRDARSGNPASHPHSDRPWPCQRELCRMRATEEYAIGHQPHTGHASRHHGTGLHQAADNE